MLKGRAITRGMLCKDFRTIGIFFRFLIFEFVRAFEL